MSFYMGKPNTIFDFIGQEEINYTMPIPIAENYDWSMQNHIHTTVMYKNSKFTTGNPDDRPFKNIIRPILNVQYRTEGFDVKDIEIYVDELKFSYKSLLVNKFHDRWARANDMDTFIDELVESYVDFGGALVKDIGEARPEVVPLQSIAFCDQTDILSSPIGIRHYFSPSQLKDMEKKGWGDEANGATNSVDDVLDMAETHKDVGKTSTEQADTPGKYVEVIEVHGDLPTEYLTDEGNDEDERFTSQVQFVAPYQDEKGNNYGMVLFRKEEKESPFKLELRDEIYGRALGIGGAEELFESQVWVNYGQIRMKGMLDAASKVWYKTDDPTFTTRNKVQNIENEEVVTMAEGSDIAQVDSTPRNINIFRENVIEWEESAQTIGAAQDPLLGEAPKSGTPFRLQALVTQQAQGLHEYRRGKLAVFVEEIYRDWIMPFLAKELTKGDEFMEILSYDEMQDIANKIAVNKAGGILTEKVLNGEIILPGEKEALEEQVKLDFMKGGNKKFFKILKDEFKRIPVDVKISIAGKQKDLAFVAEKLSNIWASLIQTEGRILQNPGMAKLFNNIISSSGINMSFNPSDFIMPQQLEQPTVPGQPAQPVQPQI